MDHSIINYESAAFINPNETKITETIIVNWKLNLFGIYSIIYDLSKLIYFYVFSYNNYLILTFIIFDNDIMK